MDKRFDRTKRLLGETAMRKLSESKVSVFGIGGVGSYAAEALVRSGLGNIKLIDYDDIDITNINRQIHSTTSTIGRTKVEVMKERLLDINPKLNIQIKKDKLNSSNKLNLIDFDSDYIIDAIDMVSSKLELISTCKKNNLNIISSMGTGNKLDPTKLIVGDIFDTKNCPLARVIRRELRKKDIRDLKVVWSEEIPVKASLEDKELRKSNPASVAFVPPVSGMIIASEVIKDLISMEV